MADDDEWLQLPAFADDTGLLSTEHEEMQFLIDIFVDACAELGLKINVPKAFGAMKKII